MILIADSGSTKTDWAVINDNGKEEARIKTQGLNPFHLSSSEITDILDKELIPSLNGVGVSQIYFYGTGCTVEQIPTMKGVLSNALHCTDVEVGSDLLGAAHALCGRGEGIACILGTGSNSCVFNGKEIVANTPPLGYILGDEGSGAVLGRLFFNGLFKGTLSNDIKELYLTETNQTYADVIRKVYREPLANRYLASVSKFIGKHIDNYPELRTLVKDNFLAFIHRNIDSYDRKDLPLGFVGSIAWYFQNELNAAARECGYSVGKILRSPLDGMVDYIL